MPRKSAAALAVVGGVDGQPSGPEPPASLSPRQRQIFVGIVNSCDRKHLRRCDEPLLAAFARAVALEEVAGKELAKNPRDARWQGAWERAVRAVAQLSAKLRLSPQSRMSSRAASRTRVPPPGPPPWFETD